MQSTNMKKSSLSLVIREMQIKTTVRYHVMPVRMVIIKNEEITDAGEDVEKQECFYTVGGSVISSIIVEDSVVIPQGAKTRNTI